jgi:pyrroline-5-carboxylate reductase
MPDLIAFVGAGNLAASLIGGLLASGHPADRLRAATRTEASAAGVRLRFGIDCGTQVQQAVEDADVVVLAVKPQQMAEALRGVRIASRATVVSVAAGLRIDTLQRQLAAGGFEGAIVRSMPNTPSLLRQGIAGLYAPAGTPDPARRRAEALLAAVGETCWVDAESQIDTVTALSGSGPAYYFFVTELLREAGAALGLDAAVAARLALKTFTGAAAMAAGEVDVAVLRAQVTSKGGTTEAALASLESAELRRSFREALQAADQRARLRGEELAHATEHTEN